MNNQTLFFCLTTALLLILVGLFASQLQHSPWGLFMVSAMLVAFSLLSKYKAIDQKPLKLGIIHSNHTTLGN